MKDNDLIRRSDVLKLQAVNAVEVVRCKDCVHWRDITDTIPGWCDIIQNYTTREWYCAEGYAAEAAAAAADVAGTDAAWVAERNWQVAELIKMLEEDAQ